MHSFHDAPAALVGFLLARTGKISKYFMRQQIIKELGLQDAVSIETA